jgi:hypothetical protein
MGLFQVIRQQWNASTNLPEIANEVADQCMEAVWLRVQYRVNSLVPNEAAGYVRARSGAVVRKQLASAVASHNVAEQLRPQLASLTEQRLYQRIQTRVREAANQQPLRRAA